ncbi:hypothetical protein LTR08_004558 [Meristemomyces frigidus]|nr:hypothetical protein LTR08_004558 [Meristemomyces frigidus]
MSSTVSLHLFPSSANTVSPRKSSLKKAQSAPAPIELRGLALQVNAPLSSTPKILPASDHFVHSLFCDPAASPQSDRSSQRQLSRPHTRRRPSETSTQILSSDASQTIDEDQLAPLPMNTHFGASSPPRRHPSSQLKRPNLPWSISIETQPDVEESLHENDRLSPLPEKTRFISASPRTSEYPTPLSESAPMRSMFPQYDPTKPATAQSYYPSSMTPVQSLPREKISKDGSPIQQPMLKRYDSGTALTDRYEHAPAAQNSDLLRIWNASNDQVSAAGRKVELPLYQPKGKSMTLALGGSAERPLFSMEKALPQSPSQRAKKAQHLAVEKQSPRGGTPVPVAQLALPECTGGSSDVKSDTAIIFVFPQAAAVYAIEAIANSPAAQEIATFDPTAKSPEAARLAQDAVAEAHRRHGCELTRTTRKRDSSGAFTATYTLEHPMLGALPITVTKSTTAGASQEPKAKISLHHPSATPAAVMAETLVLAVLDFGRDAFVLDLPYLMALDSRHIIDTAITAILAVAALESDVLITETHTFAPPPKSPFLEAKTTRRNRSSAPTTSRRWYKRSSKAIDKIQKELVGQPADVGAPVQAAVALIGLTLKTAIFVLEAGVKVTARVVVGIGKMAKS